MNAPSDPRPTSITWRRPDLRWLRALHRAGATPRRAAGHAAISLGLFVPESARSIWLHLDDVELAGAARSLVSWFHDTLPQHRLIVTTHRLDLVDWLRWQAPNDLVLPAPFDMAVARRRFLRTAKPELFVTFGVPAGVSHAAIADLARHDVPIAFVDVAIQDVERLEGLLNGVSAKVVVCPRDQRAAEALTALAVPSVRIGGVSDLRLWCGAVAQPDEEYLRRELSLEKSTAVVAAAQITRAEISPLLGALAAVKRAHPNVALLLEPAFPGDADRFATLARRQGLETRIRRDPTSVGPQPEVIVFARPCEMAVFSPLADTVLAGGSFRPGSAHCHNPAAPAASARCMTYGPYLFEGDELSRTFIENGAALQTHHHDLVAVLKTCIPGTERAASAGRRAFQMLKTDALAINTICDAIRPVLPPAIDSRPIRQLWRRPSRVERLGASPLWRGIFARWQRRTMLSWDDVNRRLHEPETILCLGNGPSSEDRQLDALSYDALFRVNCSWMAREKFTNPDVVFVGDMETIVRLCPPVFAFRTVDWERYQLFRRMLRGHVRPVPFFTMERLPLCVSPDGWRARPTNGALMILAAVMLNPRRLILGGFDLFSHPAGRYAGEVAAPNTYAQVHARDVDLEFIRACLSHYRGELIVVGEILRDALHTPVIVS